MLAVAQINFHLLLGPGLEGEISLSMGIRTENGINRCTDPSNPITGLSICLSVHLQTYSRSTVYVSLCPADWTGYNTWSLCVGQVTAAFNSILFPLHPHSFNDITSPSTPLSLGCSQINPISVRLSWVCRSTRQCCYYHRVLSMARWWKGQHSKRRRKIRIYLGTH